MSLGGRSRGSLPLATCILNLATADERRATSDENREVLPLSRIRFSMTFLIADIFFVHLDFSLVACLGINSSNGAIISCGIIYLANPLFALY